MAKFLADDSFAQDGDNYTTTYTLNQDGSDVSISFTLLMKDDTVAGYDLNMKAAAGAADESGTPAMTMDLKAGMDADNKMTVSMTLDSGSMLDMNLEMTGSYAATDKTPELTPPADATVIPYEQLITGAAEQA